MSGVSGHKKVHKHGCTVGSSVWSMAAASLVGPCGHDTVDMTLMFLSQKASFDYALPSNCNRHIHQGRQMYHESNCTHRSPSHNISKTGVWNSLDQQPVLQLAAQPFHQNYNKFHIKRKCTIGMQNYGIYIYVFIYTSICHLQ